MPRACLPQNFRPSDVIRDSSRGGQRGRRVVVISREVFDVTVKIQYRGLVKGGNGENISNTVEGFSSLSNRILFPIEGIWEGELTPGARGRVVEYNNRAYVPAKGEAKMPAAKSKTAGRKPAAKKTAASDRAPRQTEAQLDKQSAQVVKMRDSQNKSWGDIEAATGIAPSRLRQLYTRGGGASTGTRGAGATKTKAKSTPAAAKKGAAKGRTGRGKRNPS